jgi:hypothetical protein
MPPAYVKPYAKRQKNDSTDAEAICEAVTTTHLNTALTTSPPRPEKVGGAFSRDGGAAEAVPGIRPVLHGGNRCVFRPLAYLMIEGER